MYQNTSALNHPICFHFITCANADGLADQTDAGVMSSQHRNVVDLPTRQAKEITVGVSSVTCSVVAETAPSKDGVRFGTTCRVPCNAGDAGLAVHSCCDVGGNTRSWWRQRETGMYVAGCIYTYIHAYIHIYI